MKLLHTALGPIMTNCYFAVDDENNTAIIDPAANPAKIIKIIEEQGLRPVAVLLTHGHFDHIGGAKGIKEKYPEVKTLPCFLPQSITATGRLISPKRTMKVLKPTYYCMKAMKLSQGQ